ncbi:MAG: YajQ family cyclic di-GMP-binding protein [Sandaracinaceae bacterium]
MPTFDVVSKLDHHELDNALSQASREIGQRYDFKNANASVEKTDEGIVIEAESEHHVTAALSVLREKLAKRDVSQKALDAQSMKPSRGSRWRQVISLKEGIDKDAAKKITKTLKESKLKVQASIQGDVVRVTHKKRDVLQQAITLLKQQDMELPLQFQNFRD